MRLKYRKGGKTQRTELTAAAGKMNLAAMRTEADLLERNMLTR